MGGLFKHLLVLSIAVSGSALAAENPNLSGEHVRRALEAFEKIENDLVRLENSRQALQQALDASSPSAGTHKAPYYPDFDKLLENTTGLWDVCLQGSAAEFARKTAESAEAIVTAAFVKCRAGEKLLPKIYVFLARSQGMSMDLPQATEHLKVVVDARRDFLTGLVVQTKAEQN